MTAAQEGTENFSLPQEKRKRKKVVVTLSDEAREQLAELADADLDAAGNRSRMVELLIARAYARKR